MDFIGHNELKEHLKALSDNADAYRRCSVKVPNFVMNIPRGNGQSFVAENITVFLHDHELRNFPELDEMKEYRLDGTMAQTKKVFEDIRSNAVYTNEFEGVIAIDVSALAEYVNESQTDYFVEQICEVSKDATVIIYYDDSLGKQINIVKERIVTEMGNCIDINVPPYTLEEYAEIIVDNMLERGVDVVLDQDMGKILFNIIASYNVTTAKQAIGVAEKLILLADYSSYAPRLDLKALKKHFGSGISAA